MAYIIRNQYIPSFFKTAEENSKLAIHETLVRDINAFFRVRHSALIVCFINVINRIIVHSGDDVRSRGVFIPCCFFECRMERIEMFSYSCYCTQLTLEHYDSDEKLLKQKFIRLRRVPQRLSLDTGSTEKTADADAEVDEEMVDSLTEGDCLQHILHFLRDYFLPMTPVHGLK